MENFSIENKNINLEKNKEYTFQLPISFSPVNDELVLFCRNLAETQEAEIEFYLVNTDSIEKDNRTKFVSNIKSGYNYYSLQSEQINPMANYLFFGCKSNLRLELSLSIRENNAIKANLERVDAKRD